MSNNKEVKLPDALKIRASLITDLQHDRIIKVAVYADNTITEGAARYLLSTPEREAAGKMLDALRMNLSLYMKQMIVLIWRKDVTGYKEEYEAVKSAIERTKAAISKAEREI